MKHAITILTLFLIVGTSLFAQVGINTDNSIPDPSAMLDVKSSNKGLLPPRVALTAINAALPVTAPAVGLFVYNTATSGTPPNNVVPGNYCWNGTRWVAVAPPPGSNAGDMLYWDGTQWVQLPPGANGQVLTLNNNIPVWGGTQNPVITTGIAYATSSTTATITGFVISDGGESLTTHGSCYSTSSNPTTSDTKTIDGTGIGEFTSSLTGLTENALYYVRTYATNSQGAVYGSEKTFITASLPTVITTEVTDIAQYSALGSGSITSVGFGPLTSYGICWSTMPNPTTANSHTAQGGSFTGPFVHNLTGLTGNTLYYLRAYASNSQGTSYGSQQTFTTLSSPFYIGQIFGGGIIFYIDQTGLHGLISAGINQAEIAWGCGQTLIGGTATALGTGQANTTSIINVCTFPNIAARICADLVLNGKSDWFLPSKDELNQLYIHRVEVGGFNSTNIDIYWSSSEADATHAWTQNFDDGIQSAVLKQTYYVRAIRVF